MQFYDVIESRKSIKKFKNTTIPEEKVARMIDAAMMSPSWRNHTSYKFMIIDDENKKQQLSKIIINSTADAANSLVEAPLVAVVVADPSLSGNIDEREYYLVDSAIAMEHFILAATAEGYGTCWIASLNEDKARDILGIPKEYRVVGLTPIGEAAEKKAHNEKKDTRDYVFLNDWNKSYNGTRSNYNH